MKTRIALFFALFAFLTVLGQKYSIPFEEDRLVFIETTVNNDTTVLSFVFDTGASGTVLNKHHAERMGITATFQQSAGGASGVGLYDIATEQVLRFGDFTLPLRHMALIDLTHLEERSGRRIDGIIGYDIISEYITQLDFDNKKINLYEKAKEVNDIEGYSKLKINTNNSIPQVPVEFTLKNGTVIKGDFLFDSGANSNLIINTPFVQKHDLENVIGDTYLRKHSGLTSTRHSTVGYIQSATFNGETFEDIPISLSNTRSGVLSRKGFAGLLGAGIINRFQVVLDYDQGFIYLKPNSNMSKPFKHNRSGIAFIKKDGKLFVDDVVANSQAGTLGIAHGDELVKINDYTGTDMRKVMDLLQTADTAEITLRKASASNVQKVYTLTLERLIR